MRILAFISLLLSSDLVAGWVPAPRPMQLSRRRNSPLRHVDIKQMIAPSQQLQLQMPSCKRSKANSSTEIRFAFEDIVFHAENVGLSLASTVLNPSSGSATTATTTSFSILFSYIASFKSLLILYVAGVITSFSPCSLGLLPVTISYISNAANERNDKNTILPTLAYAAGLALVFTTLGVSASVLGSVFGSSSIGGGGGGGSVEGGGGGGDSLLPYILALTGPLVSVLMGLQLLDLIRVPLPSLDFKWRSAVVTFESSGGFATDGADGGTTTKRNAGSLFDENGGLVLENVQQNKNNIHETRYVDLEESNTSYEVAALLRMFLLGGTSALVASPCATPVLASLLAYLASVSSSPSSSAVEVHSLGKVCSGASWMLSYTLGYSTLLLVAGATGGQALVNLQKARDSSSATGELWQWITPLSGGVLIAFGMNGLLVALLGDPSLSALAPILE